MPRVNIKIVDLVSMRFLLSFRDLEPEFVRREKKKYDGAKSVLESISASILKDDAELFLKVYAKGFDLAADAIIELHLETTNLAESIGAEYPFKEYDREKLLSVGRKGNEIKKELRNESLPTFDECWNILIDASKRLKETGIFTTNFIEEPSALNRLREMIDEHRQASNR